MIERVCHEISWRKGSGDYWLLRKTSIYKCQRHVSTAREWHLACLYPSVIQRSKSRTQFQPPLYVGGSHTTIRNTVVRPETGPNDDGLSAFLSTRRRLFGIAYRILKSAAEAEDVVQDVWIRWQTTDRGEVRDARAFLAKTTTRLAINVVQSARSRRETTVDPSLRESVDTGADPEVEAERSEALQNAILVLLEKLSPAERVAFVLREAFDFSYREISNILRLKEANIRQLVTRARRHVADGRHAVVNSADQRCCLAALVAAGQEGALGVLESFFVGISRDSDGRTSRATRTGSTVAEANATPHARQSVDTPASAWRESSKPHLAMIISHPGAGRHASPSHTTNCGSASASVSSNESTDLVTLYEDGTAMSLGGTEAF